MTAADRFSNSNLGQFYSMISNETIWKTSQLDKKSKSDRDIEGLHVLFLAYSIFSLSREIDNFSFPSEVQEEAKKIEHGKEQSRMANQN